MKYILEERYILLEADDFDLSEDEVDLEPNTSGAPENDSVEIDTAETDVQTPSGIDWSNPPVLPNGETDWAELYKLCKTSEDFNCFWNGDPKTGFKGYYKTAWDTAEADIKKLPAEFTEILKKYGWSASTNPIVNCLKWLISKHIKITPEAYGIIHNAAAEHLVSSADLARKGVLGDNNLIFLPDLYNKSISNATIYLQLQSDVLEQATQGKIKINETPVDSSKIRELILNTFLIQGDSENLIANCDFSGTLRSVEACKQIIQTYAANGGNNSITDKELSYKINSIKGAEKSMAALAFLTSLWGETYKSIFNIIGNIEKLVTEAKLTVSDIKQVTKLFNIGTTKYTTGQIETIIRALKEKVIAGR